MADTAASYWFDAHLDLACLAVNGRDMHEPDPADAGGPWQPAAVTLPSLREARVVAALGTIFTETGGDGPEGYPEEDAEAAHRKGRAQLEAYLTWRDEGAVVIDLPERLRVDPGVGEIRGGMGVAEIIPPDPFAKRTKDSPLHIGVLMENADPIRDPEELPWWVERGVMAVGMAWWKPSRYAGGNGSKGVGLSDLGRELVSAMDELGVVHDLSHLSQAATDELLQATNRPIMASHSNCRALLGGESAANAERHLADRTIKEIARRGGVVGINLVGSFLRRKEDGGATIEDVVRHIDHVCEVAGGRDFVGLGSDMDGGISAEKLPKGIRGPSDLWKISDALRAHGWSESEVAGFERNNWLRFWRVALTHRAASASATR